MIRNELDKHGETADTRRAGKSIHELRSLYITGCNARGIARRHNLESEI